MISGPKKPRTTSGMKRVAGAATSPCRASNAGSWKSHVLAYTSRKKRAAPRPTGWPRGSNIPRETAGEAECSRVAHESDGSSRVTVTAGAAGETTYRARSAPRMTIGE